MQINTVFGGVPLGSFLSYQLFDHDENKLLFCIDRPLNQIWPKQDEPETILVSPDLAVAPCCSVGHFLLPPTYP